MKIAFIVDYLPKISEPGEFSGAEVSISNLARELRGRGDEVDFFCYADNFQSKIPKRFPDSFWINPVTVLVGTFSLANMIRSKNPDLLHVQGKNSFYSAVLANLFFRKPLVITVRDYKLLCNLGMCLLSGDKICTIRGYLKNDIPFYARKYSKKLLFELIRLFLLSPIEIIRRNIARFFLNSCQKVICISVAEEQIFNSAGIRNTMVIHNTLNPGINHVKKQNRKKEIVFVGRYSPGKGGKILDFVVDQLSKKHSDWSVVSVGNFQRPNDPEEKIIRLGQKPIQEFFNILSSASFTIVPSVWPEPFGRAALDSLAVETPVVATNRGGLPEIVREGVFGLLTDTNPENFYKAVEKMIEKHDEFRARIFRSTKKLEEDFFTKPINQHVDLYLSLKK